MGLEFFGINSASVSELFTLMSAKYKDALAQQPEPWARRVSGWSNTGVLRQKFPIDLTAFAGFREWVGPRHHKDSDQKAFYIDSKPWERTIDVPLDVALSGQFAPYINKVPNLVRAANVHPNVLLAALLAGGKTATCWDGQYFFDTDHPVDFRGSNASATYSNLKTAMPFTSDNFAAARKLFREMKAPDGKTSLGLRLTHVLGGTDMEEVFDALFRKAYIARVDESSTGVASETNIYYQGAQSIIAPELDANGEPGVWYGLALEAGVMPFETQMRGDAPEIRIFGDGTESAVETNNVSFNAKLFGNSGYAIPHCIIRFEPS